MDGVVEPITPDPPGPVRPVVFSQRWTQLTFLHWSVDPAEVAALLPAGTRPDVYEGATYVGLVPFVMRRVAAWGGPPFPYFGDFCETNVRLYSVDEQGRRGVVFRSLDAARLAPVLVARLGPGLPYAWSRMRFQRRGDRVAYSCRRRWPGTTGTTGLVRIRIGEPVTAGPLHHFLSARWALHFTDRRGRTKYWPNAHERWPLLDAKVEALNENLVEAAGIRSISGRPPDSVLFSPGVDATFGRPTLSRRAEDRAPA